MLLDVAVIEQRQQAVLEVMRGLAVSEVARRYGVTRQSVHRWLRRYAADGLSGLADLSSRPASCPHQMAPALEARIVELRLAHPGWGPRTIAHQLALAQTGPLPGRSSIYRCLVRHELVDRQRRRRRREDYRRWERSRPMELWQMDVMGGVRLDDGRELKIVSGIDDHSRYCVSALLTARATARPVCEALVAALQRHGTPDQILTDNGKVFSGRFGPGRGVVLFDRICHEQGIRHLLTAPRSPTTTGKVERFHKTVRAEFLAGRSFASLADAQRELDLWVAGYNHERPHQGIGMVPPARRFASSAEAAAPLALAPVPDPVVESPGATRDVVSRRVDRRGTISLDRCAYQVGRWLAGESVEVTVRKSGLLEVSHHGVLIACHARRKPPGVGARPRLLQSRSPRARPETIGRPVLRTVDPQGNISFAGMGYPVGRRHQGARVEVRLVGQTVQISLGGRILRTHAAHHDPEKLHGAFAIANGRPRRHESVGEGGLSSSAQAE